MRKLRTFAISMVVAAVGLLARKKTTGIILKIGNRALRNITAMQIRSGNPLGFPGKI